MSISTLCSCDNKHILYIMATLQKENKPLICEGREVACYESNQRFCHFCHENMRYCQVGINMIRLPIKTDSHHCSKEVAKSGCSE